ncbi:MAG: hypothetical protein ACPLXC_01535 [Candidatus Pacearchaeota archaeon]
MKRAFLIFLTLFLSVALTALAKADFTITTNLTTNTVCPGSTIVIEDIITALTPGAFTVATGGTAESFTTTIPQGFWLEQGQQEVFYSYITPSSKITPGNYILEIAVTQAGKVKTVKHNIIVENCHQTAIKVEPVSQAICACEERSVKLVITNNGKYLENYELNVEGPAAQWIKISSKSMTLAANSSATVMAYVNTSCNTAGTYEANFVVKSKSEYGQANAKANFSIVSCYDYSISSNKTYYSICEAEKLTIPIKIKNLGTRPNTYKINMEGPNWTKVDQRELTLANGSEGTFNLIAEPPYKTQGNFTTYIEVMTDLGKVLKKYDISLQVSKCYAVSVTIEEEKDKMCNALSNTYEVVVRNLGKFTNTYDIVLDAPEWVTISKKRITLNASKEESLVLDVHPPYNTKPTTYTIKIKAIDAVSKAEATDTLNITAVSLEECYSPAISTKDDFITVSKDSTATALFIIENKGTNDANYTLEISGTGTKFSQLNPGTLTLKTGKAQTVYLYIAPPLDVVVQDYIVTVTVRLKDTTIIASKTITIKVVEAGVVPSQPLPPATTPSTQPSLFSKIISWIASLFKPSTTNVTSNVTNVTKTNVTKTNQMNVTQTNQTNVTNKTNTTNATTNTTKNLAPVLEKKISDITLQSGSKKTIDLNDYFDDPNDDKLIYVTVKPQNLSVTIEGSEVTIEAQQGFTGTREVSFYASDGYDITQSNVVKVTVTNTSTTTTTPTPRQNATNVTKTNVTNITGTKTTGSKLFVNYLPWIIIGIIVLIIIIIIATGLGKKIVDFFEEEVPSNGKKNNNNRK